MEGGFVDRRLGCAWPHEEMQGMPERLEHLKSSSVFGGAANRQGEGGHSSSVFGWVKAPGGTLLWGGGNVSY